MLQGSTPELEKTLQRLSKLMKQGGILMSDISTQGIITDKYLPEK